VYSLLTQGRSREISRGTLVDIMRTHPMAIIGGILRQNPFFVPLQEFLGKLRDRRAKQAAKRWAAG
jgi:hypothetical protein